MLPAILDTGTGEAVLFLHAFTMDASQWDHQVAALSGDMRCVRVDLWGCGDSPPPPAGAPSLDAFAASVLEADAPGSRDDRLAMADLVEREQSVEPIVEHMVGRLLSPVAQAEAHIADPVRGRIRRCTPSGIAYAQRAIATRPDSTALLGSISVPTLVIAGTQDAIVGTAEVRAIADGIPGARYAELDCGHLSNLEEPRPVSALLGAFLTPATMTS
jgi:pimeloyl-ACP methyl ester carboxylesterase